MVLGTLLLFGLSRDVETALIGVDRSARENTQTHTRFEKKASYILHLHTINKIQGGAQPLPEEGSPQIRHSCFKLRSKATSPYVRQHESTDPLPDYIRPVRATNPGAVDLQSEACAGVRQVRVSRRRCPGKPARASREAFFSGSCCLATRGRVGSHTSRCRYPRCICFSGYPATLLIFLRM